MSQCVARYLVAAWYSDPRYFFKREKITLDSDTFRLSSDSVELRDSAMIQTS